MNGSGNEQGNGDFRIAMVLVWMMYRLWFICVAHEYCIMRDLPVLSWLAIEQDISLTLLAGSVILNPLTASRLVSNCV